MIKSESIDLMKMMGKQKYTNKGGKDASIAK